MIADPHEQMHRILNQRQTSDLLAIWQKNDRQEWSKQAIQVVGEILQERQAELPQQNQAVGEDPYENHEPGPVVEIIPVHHVELPTQGLVMGNKVYDPPEENPADEPPAQQVIAGGYVFQIPEADGAVEQTGGYYPSEDNLQEKAPEPEQESRGCLAALVHWLFSDWGTGGVYQRGPYHRVHRPRTYTSLPRAPRMPRMPSMPRMRVPARAAPTRRSVVKGRHK